MTKEAYFEMCETMGSDPVDDEIPRIYDDFTSQSQDAIDVFNLLQDKWDGASGTYLGKDLSTIDLVFRLLGIQDNSEQLLIFTLLNALIGEHTEEVNRKMSEKRSKVDIQNKGAK